MGQQYTLELHGLTPHHEHGLGIAITHYGQHFIGWLSHALFIKFPDFFNAFLHFQLNLVP